MFWNKEHFDDLRDVLVHELKDLYDAEHRTLEFIPDAMDAASNVQLKGLLQDFHAQCQQRVHQLEQVLQLLDEEIARETCPAMKGIISEAQHMISAKGDGDARDAAMIGSLNRIAHYGIAGYGTLVAFAKQLRLDAVANKLESSKTLAYDIDEAASYLAEGSVNAAAV